MDWKSTLTRLVGVTAPMGEAQRSGLVKSAQEALSHPALATARSALLAELRSRATLAELCEAGAALRRQHDELAFKAELSPAELQQLGVLSGMALALSTQAIEQALSEQALLVHAVTQIAPWLERAAACGIVALPPSARGLGAAASAVLTKTTHSLS